MNWEIAATIAEGIGAAAVAISLAYLASQIHRQTEQSRLAATREIAPQWWDVSKHLFGEGLRSKVNNVMAEASG